ncbi:MAG: hypothetical protein ACRDUV_12290 [Pseudonocardiaceae bacterium]
MFVSHTSELVSFPEKRSFVDAACAAVRRAGGVAVDMADFGARDQRSPEVCRAGVLGAPPLPGALRSRVAGAAVRGDPADTDDRTQRRRPVAQASGSSPGRLPVMAQPDDLEARVVALETQVRDLAERVRHSEQDAAAARVLAGGADRDVAEIREEIRDFRQATTSSFNAMREDLTDLRTRVGDGFAQVDRGFTEMRGKFDATAAGQQQIVHLLNTLIAQQGGQPDGQ